MKLPNGDRAIIDEAKLLDYCLSTTHPRGKHKARLFARTTGITVAEVALLRDALLAAAREKEATLTRRNDFGETFEVSFNFAGPAGSATILSVWIILKDEESPRLVTCYPV